MAGTSFSEAATRSTAQRLRRTRQSLGTYRHELMVALRVVNNIEREMLRAEWENWLLDENNRCRQVQTLLLENGRTPPALKKKTKGAKAQQIMESKERERTAKLDNLKVWHDEYCGSCRLEQELLTKGRKYLAFG